MKVATPLLIVEPWAYKREIGIFAYFRLTLVWGFQEVEGHGRNFRLTTYLQEYIVQQYILICWYVMRRKYF